MNKFEELDAWKRARELSSQVYAITKTGEFSRDFGLRDQIRRAAVSVMSNIAEGFERDGNKEFRQFLALAKGSAGEVRSQLYVALDAKYITQEQFELLRELTENTGRVIAGLMRYLEKSDLKGSKYR